MPPSTAQFPTLPALRIGEGWDCHQLVADRPLYLGGVRIPHDKGLLGHSDADVLLHAITDALLGAAGMGDIGTLFPDTDPAFKDADSKVLLREAMQRIRTAGWHIVNIDCTVVAQKPKLEPYNTDIAASIADCLSIAAEQVNVKAKTAEKLGPVGEERSMEAHAAALLMQQA